MIALASVSRSSATKLAISFFFSIVLPPGPERTECTSSRKAESSPSKSDQVAVTSAAQRTSNQGVFIATHYQSTRTEKAAATAIEPAAVMEGRNTAAVLSPRQTGRLPGPGNRLEGIGHPQGSLAVEGRTQKRFYDHHGLPPGRCLPPSFVIASLAFPLKGERDRNSGKGGHRTASEGKFLGHSLPLSFAVSVAPRPDVMSR
ncbi:hypothetical protein B0H65DRAFT_143240 [Neurospora tetraspora]|uniref:Uncharacterized protein n=1 Tax=Neurospora tetraspora TaxID=94610 RepID=A0AAE0MVH4_9PEZI|nr:hypothetical protein B0H65DRAFT_143240 [Neurospora tetraspora]